ncbi:hypothetical protein [Oribacterium sinus]|uniref:Uncharacterized protein n=1 Tax=Oribacterium sinus F0268 TaxID=585501 RepID=C2L0V8_9FIRM|nr:hypothetical protein [Oribacterium sinus]EEJ50339.1 hypothetical protein HMPREF6123_2377 [Oribacterium sinus F0268]
MHKFLRSIGFSALQEDKDAEFYLQRAVHEKYAAALSPMEMDRWWSSINFR